MKRIIYTLLIGLSLMSVAQQTNAQCKISNSAFRSGERITYDLYFNAKIMSVKAGVGFLTTSESNFEGQRVYRSNMQFNTSGVANTFFAVNDTLTSIVDMNLRPLLFTKNAFEGKDYSIERQAYSYTNNTIKIRTVRHFNGSLRFDQTLTTRDCTYDYLSVLPLIRNLDYKNMKPGDNYPIQFVSGNEILRMYVNYVGKSKVKANNGKQYNVLNITLTIFDKNFSNPKDAIKASLTDDANRIPVVLDTSLKFGSIRAVMKSASGLRH